MNELPREARAVLALAKDAHDPPDPAARERVRTKVMAAVVIAPMGLSAGAAQLAKPSAGLVKTWFGGKGALAGVLLLLAAGGSLTLLQGRHGPKPAEMSPPASADDVPAATAAAVSTAAVVTEEAPRSIASAVRVTQRAHASRAPVKSAISPGPSLREEVSLLARAAEQLEHGDAQSALRALQEHRRRFARTQLKPERDGLEVLAHCQQKQPHAQNAARAYLARTPASLLVSRIEQTCAL